MDPKCSLRLLSHCNGCWSISRLHSNNILYFCGGQQAEDLEYFLFGVFLTNIQCDLVMPLCYSRKSHHWTRHTEFQNKAHLSSKVCPGGCKVHFQEGQSKWWKAQWLQSPTPVHSVASKGMSRLASAVQYWGRTSSKAVNSRELETWEFILAYIMTSETVHS